MVWLIFGVLYVVLETLSNRELYVNTLTNTRQGSRERLSWTPGSLSHNRASGQFSWAQRSSEAPQRHRRHIHGGSAYQGKEKTNCRVNVEGWCPELEYHTTNTQG